MARIPSAVAREKAPMPIHRLNHAVLYVSELAASTAVYCDILGFRKIGGFPGAVFLRATGSANDHDLGLFQAADAEQAHTRHRDKVGLYHLAWEVDTLSELARMHEKLQAAGALTGSSDHGSTKALYGIDPDGLEFEIRWLVSDHAVEQELLGLQAPSRPLDLAGEIAKYGPDTTGGPRLDHSVWDRLKQRGASP